MALLYECLVRSLSLQVSDHSCDVLSAASNHTFTNGRTSYSHHNDYRQERTEERGDVRKRLHSYLYPTDCPPSSRHVFLLSTGRLFNVHPVDAHRGSDLSVDTEPDDGVPPTLQPVLQTVRTNTHTHSGPESTHVKVCVDFFFSRKFFHSCI